MKQVLWVVVSSAFLIVLLVGCNDDSEIVSPQTKITTSGLGSLSYSGIVILGGPRIPWTGQSGMLVFAVVKNNSDGEWRGYPEAAAYTINEDNTRGELISTGQGVLTTHVNREQFIPTDQLSYIPGNEERESLTFVPVDFSVNPLVYVYWRFADENNADLSFQHTIRNPKVQPLKTLTEAKTLLESR